VVALGVAAVSPFASVMIFFVGCYGLVPGCCIAAQPPHSTW
jgi:hypothetical protein